MGEYDGLQLDKATHKATMCHKIQGAYTFPKSHVSVEHGGLEIVDFLMNISFTKSKVKQCGFVLQLGWIDHVDHESYQ